MSSKSNDDKARICAIVGWAVLVTVIAATVVFSLN